MKINGALFKHLTLKSPEILEKFDDFIKTIEIEKKEEKVFDWRKKLRKIIITLSSYHSKVDDNPRTHIGILYEKNGNINSFVIWVTGDIIVEKEVEKKNFFGKITRTTEQKISPAYFICYPFVPIIDEIHDFNSNPSIYKQVLIDYDEFFSSISETQYNSRIDLMTLMKIQQFISGIITDYTQELNEAENSLEDKIATIDKNRDGKADIVEASDLMKLLHKNQEKIIEIDKDYVHKFVRISNYLSQRSQNIQSIFNKILNEESISNKEELIGLLTNQIHIYELLMFHSINMIVSLTTKNLVSFYEIYETFDKLNALNSNWENEVSDKLINIGKKLDDLMYSIHNMEQNIVNELSHLSYITQESYAELNESVTHQLKELGSSIDLNNLLTGIQAYQLYKINK